MVQTKTSQLGKVSYCIILLGWRYRRQNKRWIKFHLQMNLFRILLWLSTLVSGEISNVCGCLHSDVDDVVTMLQYTPTSAMKVVASPVDWMSYLSHRRCSILSPWYSHKTFFWVPTSVENLKIWCTCMTKAFGKTHSCWVFETHLQTFGQSE